ncbi:hypothetical protein [Massilia sp. CF038]|uniref:hypothetical protein n=1 Tax=Massilia sp. CF038 TaxID=1881045 RepID=UPI00091717F1|nr:hypothetical protein [Massilia sp. CF038]SHH16272.1 hypothetical protein SAMN05428948_3098 [Massilia sp. CF038]
MTKIFFLPLLALATLTGCDKPVTQATATTAPAKPGAHAGESWELVTLQRSDPVNWGVRTRKVSYDMCVGLAELKKIPVQPFPTVPDDFEDEKVTRITNGVSTVVVTETSGGIEGPDIEGSGDCKMTVTTTRSKVVSVSHAGKTTQIVDGVVEEVTDNPPWPAYAPRGKSTADYTVARTVNGVQLRCWPDKFWLLNTNTRLDAREMCVYHLDNVMVDESGDPVTARSHVWVDIAGPAMKHMVKMEPVSMRRIGPSEKDPYQVSTWLK